MGAAGRNGRATVARASAPAERKAAALDAFRRTCLAGARDADTRVGVILDADGMQKKLEELRALGYVA